MARKTLDVRGRACPAPIIELMRAMREAAAGDTVEVLADDRAFPADVSAWCKKTDNRLLRLEERGTGHVAEVEKGAAR